METLSQTHHPSRVEPQAPPRPAMLSFLLFAGWAITLLYFPSGLLHYWLGPNVYARDILLALHLALTLAWLGTVGLWTPLLRGTWPLLIPLLLLVPGMNIALDPSSGSFVKWFIQWFDFILIGYLLALHGGSGKAVRAFCLLTIALLAADYAAGFYEWRSDRYVIPVKWGERTALGMIMAIEGTLRGHIRLRGLQRDVFSFANMMALGCVAALSVACLARRAFWTRLCSLAAVGAFGGLLFVCGGRSSFAGILAASLLVLCLFVDPDLPRPVINGYLYAVLGLALVISCYGVGNLTEAISSAMLAHTHIGDSESAFMRDEIWRDFFDRIRRDPSVLLAGAPVCSLFNRSITPVIDVSDNQFIWSLYHFGIAGCAAFCAFFFRCLRLWVHGAARSAHLVLVLFLLLLVGDGIARESLFYLCSLPAFIACGFLWGCVALSPVPRSSPPHG